MQYFNIWRVSALFVFLRIWTKRAKIYLINISIHAGLLVRPIFNDHHPFYDVLD